MYKKLYKNKIQLKNKSEQAKTTVKMSCPVMSNLPFNFLII
jgi:hypothetical protein